LENNEVKWLSESQNKGNKCIQEVNESVAKPKYTSGGRSKGTRKGLTRRYGGWRSDGIKRFNEILHLVKEDRIKNGGWFDEVMMNRLGVPNKRTQQKKEDEEEWVLADNDLFDDVVVIPPISQDKQIELSSQKDDDDDDDDDDDNLMQTEEV
jgi:hypothetical protein